MLEAGKDFGRYLDVDGDGIPYRTYPGTHPTRGAYFTRGTTKDRYARYSEDGPDLRRQHAAAAAQVRDREAASCRSRCGATPRSRPAFGAIYYGSTAPAMRRGAGDCSPRRASTSTRCACAPSRSTTRVADFIAAHDQVFVVEQNRDAQLRIAARQRAGRRSGAAASRCCTTTARRSPRASSSARSPSKLAMLKRDAAAQGRAVTHRRRVTHMSES